MIKTNKKLKKTVVAVLSMLLLAGAIAAAGTVGSHAAGEKAQKKKAWKEVFGGGNVCKSSEDRGCRVR